MDTDTDTDNDTDDNTSAFDADEESGSAEAEEDLGDDSGNEGRHEVPGIRVAATRGAARIMTTKK